MRYHIETIPVLDAYGAQSECPLCDLQRHVEQSYVESFLGASVMEPAVRIEVNQKGFCGPHFNKLYRLQNRLGLALITHTHLMKTLDNLRANPPKKATICKRKTVPAAPETCMVCDRMNHTMERYLRTVLHLWKTNGEFQKMFNESKGHCLTHYQKLRQTADGDWRMKNDRSFSAALYQLQVSNMERIEQELKRFTEKFDYRNTDAPWGETKNSLERAINKLRGKHIEARDKS